jgi:uncharacterized protein YvpB
MMNFFNTTLSIIAAVTICLSGVNYDAQNMARIGGAKVEVQNTVNQASAVTQSFTETTIQNVADAVPAEMDMSPIVVNNDTETEAVYLQVSNMEQNPELPTGCEAVSATIVLNYYGADMSKTEIVDNYLPYASSPYNGFVGSPYEQPNGHGHWCTAAPIVIAMNRAIEAHGMDNTAVNISGSDFDTVLSYVKNGQPVVFWGLENMSSGYHTLALIGYDKAEGVCYFADPLKSGIQTYSMDATRRAYNKRGKQAVIVQ